MFPGRFLALLTLAAATVAAQPKRIVSTTPSITETLYALGLGDRVVAVTDYCHYPPEAAKKPKIGTYVQPNVEMITSLRPDLVVVEKNPLGLTNRLRAMKLNVLEIEMIDIAHILDSISAIGSATHSDGARLRKKIEVGLAEVRARTLVVPRRKAMFVVSRSKGALEGLMTAGKASYINEIMVAAGGANIFGDAIGSYPKVTLEDVLARNPEVIIDMGEMAETTGVTERQKQAVVALWGKVPSLTAVREKRVHAVASDVFVVPGPRIVEAAKAFAAMLHPEVVF